MSKVIISRDEYIKLKRQSNAYKRLTRRLLESIIKDPIVDLVSDFRKTELYTEEFLIDLEKGLRKSSYSK